MRLGLAVLLLAGLLCACGGTPSAPAGPLPADVAKLLPAGAQVVDAQQARMQPQRAQPSWAVLYTLPNPPSAPSGSPRYNASLSIADQRPAGWAVAKSMSEVGPLGAKLRMATVAGLPAAAVSFGIGANSSGLWLVRSDGMSYAVVYDGTGDSVTLRDLDGDGTPEVVRAWSPFCQSHVASPRLTSVYAFDGGRYVLATSRFPDTIAQDAAGFRAALVRAANPATQPAWKPADTACLHGAMAFLAGESGDVATAQAELTQARQLDPGYDLSALEKRAG